MDALLRVLWMEGEAPDVQRLYISRLWLEPEYRPILGPLEPQLRQSGLLA